jgi:competence ComEA-like helix-hairpin-helix protein
MEEFYFMRRENLRWTGCLIFAFALLAAADLYAQTPAKTAPKAAGKTQALKGKTVNINTAAETDLVKNVPLITPELAKKIVKYRGDNGDFQTLEELLQIDGFNRDLLRRIKPFLLLEGIGGKDCTC